MKGESRSELSVFSAHITIGRVTGVDRLSKKDMSGVEIITGVSGVSIMIGVLGDT